MNPFTMLIMNSNTILLGTANPLLQYFILQYTSSHRTLNFTFKLSLKSQDYVVFKHHTIYCLSDPGAKITTKC